jgi:putative restriction endonuclease
MPRLTKSQLFERVERAITDSGWNILYLSPQTGNPRRFQIHKGEESYRLRIYIWNMTHGGGRARPHDEFRIQITGINKFEAEVGGTTLILGWWDEIGVLAAFDFHKHAGRLGYSPSIQIREEFLRRAYRDGLAPCDKGNKEIAIAVRPDFLVEYIRHSESLHGFGDSHIDFEILDSVSKDPQAVNDEDLARVSQPRQVTVSSIRRRLRDTSFRNRVLTAYAFRCAACGLQLELVEAAHIIPVSHEQSTDETSNGVALCVLHHAAFDRALIGLNEDYSVAVNDSEMQRLRDIRRDGGMDKFVKALRLLILLPPAVNDRPNTNYIRIGNEARGWSQGSTAAQGGTR